MSNRERGYGLSAECQDKIDMKRDPVRTQEAEDWIEAVTGNKVCIDECGLKDGMVLCELINTLEPGSVVGVKKSSLAFKKMDNIGKFLKACEDYGVTKTDLFQTVDLYEEQNLPQVVNSIHALGRKAQCKCYDGPTLGVKESAKHERHFTDDQLKQGQSIIGLQMGSNKGASQAGSTPYGLGRQIERTNLNC